ncbi:MAG TPA: HAD-IA family hydrolase [Planctomycetota bacterium]|jgi:putative hydrolase of the HAD superfamily|nr:haloacid dehalogenase [Planctomycetota bacterium]MDP7245873.1 HAD-IA family hydrolase [Planctomycetota bacterium]HJM39095.1 HAD-IA family hydrolase [Planctomycetota bacterium]|tara:strand:- start:11264 stop:11983 length:720 start_codon:yes stop_codon:yes gene_type:complete
MSLRAIFFDIDDTLYSSTEFAGQAREKAVESMIARGLCAEKEDVLAELQQVVIEFGSNDSRHFDRLLNRLPQSAVGKVNPALLVMAGVISYHETKWKKLTIRPEAHGLLEDLSSTDLRLGIISAGLAGKQMEKVLRLGLDRFLDPQLLFITDQVGMAKTNPAFYAHAAEVAGFSTEEAMHVGDHPLKDVDSAKRAGMITVLHHGSGKYADLSGGLEPDYKINALNELREILNTKFGISL